MIPLLKALGFLSPDGSPTPRYHEYRDRSQSRKIMGAALKDAYGDIFILRSNPTEEDKDIIEGKFKSVHNTSDRMAKLMTSTFFSLLALADLSSPAVSVVPTEKSTDKPDRTPKITEDTSPEAEGKKRHHNPTLHYNIQIHLPATKDIEVFNAIFRALKEHLLE